MNWHDIHLLATRLAGGSAAVSYILYIRGVVRQVIIPSRATWFIWAVVSILLLAGLLANGEREMIWIPWTYAVGSSITFLFTIKYGEGGWTKLDVACISCAASSLVVWKIMGTPQLPIMINIFADLMGFLPTFKKSVIEPLKERNPGWILFLIGNFFNFFTVTKWSRESGIYAVYMFAGCLLTTILVYRPVSEKKAPPFHRGETNR